MSHTRCKIVVFPAFARPIISTRNLSHAKRLDDLVEAMDMGDRELRKLRVLRERR